MRLKRMTATFGCLEHQTLELTEGFNLVTLPNEGGKSTWAAFLRVMLYGLNTRERDKKDFIADKNRYAPWSGSPMEGELICAWKGQEIRVRRTSRNGAPMAVCEITDTATGEPVPGLTGENLGDVLIGVSRSVFERSAFLTQSGMAVSQTPELEKRLAALVSSGEEGVSASQVRHTLTDWQRKRQYRTKGTIPTLTQRKEELNTALNAMNDTTAQVRKCQTEMDRLEEARVQLQYQVNLYDAFAEDAQAKAYQKAKSELEQTKQRLARLRAQLPEGGLPEKAELEHARDEVAYLRTLDGNLKLASKEVPEARETLEKAKAAMSDPVFSGTASEAREEAQRANREIALLEQKAAKQRTQSILYPVIALVPAILGGGACVMKGLLVPGLICAAVLVILGVLGFVFAGNARKKTLQECDAVLQRYHAADVMEISRQAEDYARRVDAVDKAADALARVERSEEELGQQRSEAWNQLRDLVQSFAPEVHDVFGFSAAISKMLTLLDAIAKEEAQLSSAQRLFDTVAAHGSGSSAKNLERPVIELDRAKEGVEEAKRRIDALQSELSMALGRRSTLGDPEAAEFERERIDRMLEREQADYEALSIALEVLEQADGEMRSRFSPELNRLAGTYFNRLTEGRYEKVRLNREMEAGAELTGSVTTRDVLTLSRGTVDQLWLAVRLAICDLALPEEEPCPLVLDEALTTFDDHRAGIALELLKELGEKRQILLFTCHGREQQLLEA